MTSWNKILVGVDGSDCSRLALRWAVTEAAEHGAEVLAVAAWNPAPTAMGAAYGSFALDEDLQPERMAQQVLDETLQEVRANQLNVTVRSQVSQGSAAKVLIDASAEADLLVVGTRGHGGFAGLLLGSVSQHVAAHAACNVVVVRR